MTPTRPNVYENGKYSVSETCQILGIHRNTLASYTSKGAIKCTFRRVNARKVYSGAQILALWGATL